jgi:PhoPQ-activated pathogenicity-related protein
MPMRYSIPLLSRRHAFAFIALTLAASSLLAGASPDALSDYIGCPDDSFAWKQIDQRTVEGFSATRLELTSQTWRSNVWQHQILVVRPPEVRHPEIAFVLITGDGAVDKQFPLLRTLAVRGGALAAVINRVPNQPLYDGRKEDALVAYTFDQYVKTGEPTWPLLFPMAKSAVRAMDAVQEFAQKEFGRKPERFVVAGGSKRGWTTWLSAASDGRVKAIAPMVIDMLNMKAQAKWAEQMYGRQSEQVKDYTDLNLTARMDEPRMVELRQWVDPYSYRNRYRIPKLLLLGTNDPYWVVDSLRHYWADLPEPKLVFQTPNAGHDLAGGQAATQTLAAFFQMIADGQQLPQMNWRFQKGSTNSVCLEVTVNPPAKGFRIWTADSPIRDFRKARWSASELASLSGTNALATIPNPASGFRAYLVEAEFIAPGGESYRLSTEARVTPDGPPSLAVAEPSLK